MKTRDVIDSPTANFLFAVVFLYLLMWALSWSVGGREQKPVRAEPTGYYLAYSFQVDSGEWETRLIWDRPFESLLACQELGQQAIKQRYHEHSRFECISR